MFLPRLAAVLRPLLFLLVLAAAPAAEFARKTYDLPADSADAALKRLAAASGLEILFATEMTAGLRTPAVRGEFTALEAANRLLAQTRLTAVQNSRTGAITINRAAATGESPRATASGAPPSPTAAAGATGLVLGSVADDATGARLAGAVVRVVGRELATATGTDGTFLLTGVPAGPVELTISYVGYAARTFPATVGSEAPARVAATLTPEVIQMQAFRVEGAREGQARAINQQRAAINIRQIVAADAIGNFPDVNAAEALKRLPGISTVRQRGEDRDITIRGATPTSTPSPSTASACSRWALKLEATNLTAAPEQQYVGTSERNLYYGDTGRSYAVGVTWNY